MQDVVSIRRLRKGSNLEASRQLKRQEGRIGYSRNESALRTIRCDNNDRTFQGMAICNVNRSVACPLNACCTLSKGKRTVPELLTHLRAQVGIETGTDLLRL